MKAWVLLILVLGLLFRLYNYSSGFYFAHDQDLYSWIAKDIVVNGHNRLIGQLTSVDGVFIGSFYYYLMAVFYKFGGMNPLSAVIPITIIGLFNIWSFYFVVKKHFGTKAGLWAAFIYSVSFGAAMFDRWSVPTQPTVTWSIWFLYIILETLKGNLKVLPIYGFLCGFVWQLHIALLPILPLPILAYVLSKNNFLNVFNKKNIKVTFVSVLIFGLTLSPFLLFEFKHNFSQIKAMVVGINVDKGGPTGVQKLAKVLDASGREFQKRLLFDYDQNGTVQYWVILLIVSAYLVFNKIVKYKYWVVFGLWFGLILLAQYTSKRVVSEYYFTNLLPIYILILSIALGKIKYKWISVVMVIIYLGLNLNWLFNKSDIYDSYYYKMQVVNFIKADVKLNNYPCVAVNFIADPGVGVGFRYLFWWQNITLVKPGIVGIPAYNIPIPWQISQKDGPTVFGRFGVILPPVPKNKIDPAVCNRPENQLDPLLGYVE
ncbi:MAG: glycosyltransferase family 39 protein [Candidatus Shapirobacteria bacterium]